MMHAVCLLLMGLALPCRFVLLFLLPCRQGAVQFAYGPPPDADGKSYAVQTRMLPAALGGPSVEELQEGRVQLVPGTYQIVFEEDY